MVNGVTDFSAQKSQLSKLVTYLNTTEAPCLITAPKIKYVIKYDEYTSRSNTAEIPNQLTGFLVTLT